VGNYKYKVAIVCTTYNHEKYISEAIESFLEQETDFPFQIIVHDDASTDRTPEIIKSYQRNYPNIIFPIFQSSNKLSQGIEGRKQTHEHICSIIDSQYIAICEGDDKWNNSKKLKIQADYLDRNSSYSMVVHNALTFDRKIGKFIGYYNLSFISRKYTIEDILLGKARFPTASFFMRSEVYINRPYFHFASPVGDDPTVLFAALNGNIRYLALKMSVYNLNNTNSWTSNRNHWTVEDHIRHYIHYMKMYEEFDKYTDFNYSFYSIIARVHSELNVLHLIKRNSLRKSFRVNTFLLLSFFGYNTKHNRLNGVFLLFAKLLLLPVLFFNYIFIQINVLFKRSLKW